MGRNSPESAARGKRLRRERIARARSIATHTKAEWLALCEACENKCVRCGCHAPLVRDHIKPIYQGGCDGIKNIQPLCWRCNCSKGPECDDHRPDDWALLVALDPNVLSERLTRMDTA